MPSTTLNKSAAIHDVSANVPSHRLAGLRQYAETVVGLAQTNLAGLTAYGDALFAAADADQSAVSSVLVLRENDLGLLRLLAERGSMLGGLGVAAPVVMTPAYIEQSLDTFPLELMEIHQRRATLAGDDHFTDIAIDNEHLRLQCERESKRILIRMRQGLLAAGGREDALAEIEIDVGIHLARTLRGVLWLRDQHDWLPPQRVVAEAEGVVGAELPGARKAVGTGGEHGWREFESLYRDVETVARMVDGM